jgi:glycosyltransferase domain-containing protein
MVKITNSNEVVTVLIFSCNRPDYLKKAIKYWSQYKGPVIVADGSIGRILDPISKNIEYLHRPGTGLIERIQEMSNKVNTRYAVLAPDDDFIGFEGLQSILKFLNEHPDYSSAQGLYTRFSGENSPSYISWFWDYCYAAKYSHVDSSEERILVAMSHPIMHYCYSVMKLECLKSTLGMFDGIDEDSMPPSTFELSFIFSLMSHGKYATLPIFYMAREAQNARHGNKNFSEWVNLNSTSGYGRWRTNICQTFHKERGYPMPFSVELVDQSVQRVLDGHAIKKNASSNVDKNSLINLFKEKIKSTLSINSINVLSFIIFKINRFRCLYGMFGFNISAYILFFKDWNKIKLAIKDQG